MQSTLCTMQQNMHQGHDKYHGITVPPQTITEKNCEKPTVSYHICRELVSRKVFHIFMVFVDYFRQFAPIHGLLKHPHFHSVVKFGILGSIGTHYLGNGRTPVLLIVQS